MARFDKFVAEQNAVPLTNGHSTLVKAEPSEVTEPAPQPAPKSNQKRKSESQDCEDESELSNVPVTPTPKKKRKPEPVMDDDAVFAARLQAEENSRARPTRGGANRKNVVVKKKKAPKKKTSDKVKAEDDSDLDGTGTGEEKKVNRSGGFHVQPSVS